jgi:hypothetical protein
LSVTWNSILFQGDQQRSSLEQAVSQLQQIYIDPTQLASTPLIINEYERATDHQLSSTNGVTVAWQALPWLRLNATGGLNTINRTDETYIPYGVNSTAPESTNGDTTGSYGLGKGTSQVLTLNLGTSIPVPMATLAVGINFTNQSIADVSAYTSQLAPGVTRPTSFPTIAVNGAVPSYFGQSTDATSTYGWYVQPTFHVRSRFFISPGFRLDGGSASGRNTRFTGFPKIDLSYLAVDQDHPFGLLTLFRPRLAFGYAGTQPGTTEKLRLFQLNGQDGLVSLDGGGTYVPSIMLTTVGNTQLRPERTSEVEGGFDADFADNRFELTFTTYNKIRHDAIISVPVPPSVISNQHISRNIGIVQNTGTEFTIGARLIDHPMIGWNVNANISQGKNKVVRLNPGESTIIVGNVRVEAGYPLWGQWARPIVSYIDENQDGVIQYTEIRLGDSAIFVGQNDPKYQANVLNTLSFMNGRLNVTAGLSYQNGLTQQQGVISRDNKIIFNLPNKPGTSFATQAAVVAATSAPDGTYSGSSETNSPIGLIQTVNILRVDYLSIVYAPPASVAHWFKVPSMSIALKGSNLGLHTNYRGADPNVNAFSTSGTSERLLDTGQLPQPRSWELEVRLGN